MKKVLSTVKNKKRLCYTMYDMPERQRDLKVERNKMLESDGTRKDSTVCFQWRKPTYSNIYGWRTIRLEGQVKKVA